MRIVVCLKEVLDPDAVDNYALAGRLQIAADGKSLVQGGIPRLINAYDEQALEAALRLRDAGAQCQITAVSVDTEATGILRHASSLGADEVVAIALDPATVDCAVVAAVLTAYVRTSGGADLVLCGRQASDDDQGVIPALVGEALGMPVVTIARAVELVASAVRVTRVTPDGDEVVEATCPAVVTISSELGTPRYPTTAKKMAAREVQPKVVAVADLGLAADALQPRTRLVKQFVPTVQGSCEFLTGATPAELATQLFDRLRRDGVVP
jgi:electron transfer flavoprotein beta subunit